MSNWSDCFAHTMNVETSNVTEDSLGFNITWASKGASYVSVACRLQAKSGNLVDKHGQETFDFSHVLYCDPITINKRTDRIIIDTVTYTILQKDEIYDATTLDYLKITLDERDDDRS